MIQVELADPAVQRACREFGEDFWLTLHLDWLTSMELHYMRLRDNPREQDAYALKMQEECRCIEQRLRQMGKTAATNRKILEELKSYWHQPVSEEAAVLLALEDFMQGLSTNKGVTHDPS